MKKKDNYWIIIDDPIEPYPIAAPDMRRASQLFDWYVARGCNVVLVKEVISHYEEV